MKAILKNEPCDGETHELPDHCLTLRRGSKGPAARYKNSGTVDAQGRYIFEHWPPKPGELEPTKGVHDA